jgi:ribonuclease HII
VKDAEAERLKNLTKYERELRKKGYRLIAGMDEAGRGPLAGPVVAACVVMPQRPLIPGIDDSKKISEEKRERLYGEILDAALGYGIGIVPNEEIDAVNIRNATLLAFSLAYENLSKKCDYLLIDGLDVIKSYCAAEAVVKGDGTCYSIAAASIVAKVTRDRLMREYDAVFPEYGFSKHKGYGTKAHQDALLLYGPCAIHRRTFIKKMGQVKEDANP